MLNIAGGYLIRRLFYPKNYFRTSENEAYEIKKTLSIFK